MPRNPTPLAVGDTVGNYQLLDRRIARDAAGKSFTQWQVSCRCGWQGWRRQTAIRTAHADCAFLLVRKSEQLAEARIRRYANCQHLAQHPLYAIWAGIRHRTSNPKSNNWHNYGGRGIQLHPEWQTFPPFATYIEAELGPKPSPQHSLDRINNDGHYEPGNLRWATPQQQSSNRRCNRFVTYQGELVTFAEAARRSGLHVFTAMKREQRGWPESLLFAHWAEVIKTRPDLYGYTSPTAA